MSAMDLYSVLFIVFVVLVSLGIMRLFSKAKTNRREDTFKLIAKDFRLTYTSVTYKPDTLIKKDIPYPLRTLKGSIANKEVVIEDAFVNVTDRDAAYSLLAMQDFSTGTPRFSAAYTRRFQTQITVEGKVSVISASQTFDQSVGRFFDGRSFAGDTTIRTALAQIKSEGNITMPATVLEVGVNPSRTGLFAKTIQEKIEKKLSKPMSERSRERLQKKSEEVQNFI